MGADQASSPPQEEEKVASIAEVFSTATAGDVALMICGSFAGVFTGATIPGMNILFGMIVDDLNDDPNSLAKGIAELCVSLAILAAINFMCGYIQVYCWTLTGERQAQRFRENYVNSILSQEVGWFDDCGAATLATQVTNLTGKMQDGITRKMGDFFQYTSQILSCIVVAFYFNWKISLVMLGTVPLMGMAGTFMISAITASQSASLTEYAAAGGIATETLGAIRTISTLNAQPHFIMKYREKVLETLKIGLLKSFKVGLGNGMMFGVYLLIYALGFWYGGELVAEGMSSSCSHNCVSGGKVLTVFLSITIGSEALGQIAPPVAAFAGARAAVSKMLEVINRKPLVDGLSNAGITLEVKPRGDIALSNVCFAYPARPDVAVCKNYDLSVKAGETVALVGPSGCGKSTIVNLLLRFYDPQSGTIALDGINIKDLNLKSLRSVIGYVGQEPVMFAGSFLANISVGLGQEHGLSSQQLLDRVQEAAKAANAHEFISSFPDGYNTIISTGSTQSMLSGGQKQRIAIARALIKKPAILLLDEATSALDTQSEKVVQESIDRLSQSRAQTTIVIAHRLSTIVNADRICVIQAGQIVEIGSHNDLLERNGVYADLVRLQLGSQDEATKSTGAEGALVEDTDGGNLSADAENAKLSSRRSVKVADQENDSSVAWRVGGMLMEHPVLMFGGIVGSLLFGGTFPVWGYLLARAQTALFEPTAHEVRTQSLFYALMFILIAGVAFFSAIMQYYSILAIGEKLAFKLRCGMFEALMRYPVAYFDHPLHSVGHLTTQLAEDTRLVHRAFSEALAKQLMALSSVIVGFVLAFSATWKMSLVVLTTFPLMVGASAVQMQAFQGQQHEDASASQSKPAVQADGTDALASESPGALVAMVFPQMRTVAAFSMQGHVSKAYAAITRQRRDERIKRAFVGSLAYGASNSTMLLCFALMFWYGSTLMVDGEITFQDLMIAAMGLMFAAMGLGQALNEMGDQKTAYMASARIFRTIDEAAQSAIDGLDAMKGVKPVVKGRIELRGVRFAYPSRPSVEVCKDYSLTVEPGETVALVGPSGSGKSTIVSMLLRFYDPLSGQVLIDGVDVKEFNIRHLRSTIGYVGQEPTLFEGSVQDNVVQGRATRAEVHIPPLEAIVEAHSGCASCQSGAAHGVHQPLPQEVDEEAGIERPGGVAADVRDACVAANAHEFISSFPEGYNCDVGASSVMISGGQKQRIAIARALIKKPAILLLDEATSALDAQSEKVVQESIDRLSQSRAQTTIVIAHRLSTIVNADRICVMDGGRIVEMGTHEALVRDSTSLYAQMWRRQFSASQSP